MEREMTNDPHEIIARQMMQNLLYEAGGVNRLEPETESRYPSKHVKAISITAGVFFDAHPELLTDEDLENICCGEYNEIQDKYGIYPEYSALDSALTDFFEEI